VTQRVASPILNTISLCSGVGMLDEAVRLGAEFHGVRSSCVAYVERDSYAAATLLARMDDAALEPAPVWCGDLGEFDAGQFRGVVDCLTAGFPCQPWSAAGKQQGTDDERWLWPAIVRILRDAQPSLVFLENVPGLVSGGGLHHVLDDLAEAGFDAQWCHLAAEACRAAHKRERVFVLAHAGSANLKRRRDSRDVAGQGGQTQGEGHQWQWGRNALVDSNAQLADAARRGLGIVRQLPERDGQPDGGDGAVGHSERPESGSGNGQEPPAGVGRHRPTESGESVGDQRDGRRIKQPGRGSNRRTTTGRASATVGDTSEPGLPLPQCDQLPGSQRLDQGRAVSQPPLFAPGPQADWRSIPEVLYPATEPGLRVLVDGMALVVDASRADQLRCGGNGVVAIQGAVAFIELMRRVMAAEQN
jgi:DNA (cytosine-5)-methyltransferase 1